MLTLVHNGCRAQQLVNEARATQNQSLALQAREVLKRVPYLLDWTVWVLTAICDLETQSESRDL